ncbi:MAG: D-alanyl-D-alanine carboxypeptidase/D-alanyl-D-alanine-endopeptidase [Bdellovibrionales bacterium]|nr:D-alanyl-D-alanine carboxypeptidase/D-alanyl-D-alanine-endopeptidase [Bdellovibrionales bacterium]
MNLLNPKRLIVPNLSGILPWEAVEKQPKNSNMVSIKIIIFLICLFPTLPCWSKNIDWYNQKFKAAIRKSGIPTHQLGLIVSDEKEILYQMNADQDFIPASLIKILTASALLDSLSPSFQFTTRLLAKNKIKNAILKGNLYLQGGGDPSFVSESLWNLVNNLTRNSLKTIEGDLIVDDSRFDKERKGPRLPQGSHSSYDAPVGALSFNWNTANIYLRPGSKVGTPLRVTVDPSSLYFSSIEKKTKTLKKKRKKHISIHRRKEKHFRESLKITGSLSLHHPEILIYRNILFPSIWTGWNTIHFLQQRNIQVTGQVKRGLTPRNARVLAEWQSRHLTEHIKLMMKYSNNFMVEMLIKNMVVELEGKTGNLTDGLNIIKKHIHKIGIPSQEYRLVQASGLSRKNKIKPRHLLTVLKYWLHHPLQPEFESSLPLANEDGTLKKYFKKPALKGRIHAKTGSLKGVTGLAGYIITRSGKKNIFVFLFNGPSSQVKIEQLFQECAYIIWAS